MRRLMLPPVLLGLALASMLAAPLPTRAAEPLMVFTPGALELDPIAKILRTYLPTAVFVGRDRDGAGYVLVSPTKAIVITIGPNSVIRIQSVDPAKMHKLVANVGWAI